MTGRITADAEIDHGAILQDTSTFRIHTQTHETLNLWYLGRRASVDSCPGGEQMSVAIVHAATVQGHKSDRRALDRPQRCLGVEFLTGVRYLG